jgi:hypothetical protein
MPVIPMDQIHFETELADFHLLVLGYGVRGLRGQISLSSTHKESKPSFSAILDRLTTFSFVACSPIAYFAGY